MDISHPGWIQLGRENKKRERKKNKKKEEKILKRRRNATQLVPVGKDKASQREQPHLGREKCLPDTPTHLEGRK